MNFSTRELVALREEQGLTRAQVAQRARLDEHYYGKVERGEYDLTGNHIVALSSAFGLSMDAFAARVRFRRRLRKIFHRDRKLQA